MKRFLSSLLFLTGLALSTGACSPTDESVKTEDPAPTPDPEPAPSGKRALVVYFSCTNTTRGVAEQIAVITGSKTHRIEPEVAYTSADLDYNNSSSRANCEQNDPLSRPAIGIQSPNRKVPNAKTKSSKLTNLNLKQNANLSIKKAV